MPTILRVAYEVILPILLSAAFGFIVGRRFHPDPKALSKVAIYLFLPALVFTGTSTSQLNPADIGRIVLLVVLFFIVLSTTGLIFTRVRRIPPDMKGAVLLGMLLANGGNYGLPFVEFAFGPEALSIGIIVFTANSIATNTLGVYVASAGRASIRDGLRNVLSVPAPYAILLGFTVNFTNITLPLPLERSISLLGEASVPLMVALLGIQLSNIVNLREFKGQYGNLIMTSAMRLMLSPLIVLLLAPLLGVTGLMRDIMLVQLSAPTAVIATLFATEFGGNVRFVTAVVFITTLASLLTLSIIMAVFVT